MATSEDAGSIQFRVDGSATGAVQAVNQANNAFAQLEQAVAANWWGLQNLGLAFAALPAAVAAGVGVAVSYAKQWEDSMFELQRTTGLAGEGMEEDFAKVEASILRVARTSPLATTELAAFAAEGAALGVANQNLDEFARIMGVLVSSTDLTEASLADVSRVLNILNVPVSEYENFASALIDVGRNTAATESEIINFSRRVAGVANVAGLTADQVLGLSAAVLSLGPRAESGATGLTRTFTQMSLAIAQGGEQLDAFAQITGKTTEEFANAFRADAGALFADFVTGLGTVEDGAIGMALALDAAGADGQRQIQALEALASGTRDFGNEQTDVNRILQTANESYREGNSLADIEAAKLNTLAGQLQVLRNIIFEAGQAFGNFFLPFLKTGIGLLSDLGRGLEYVPGPVKAVLAVVVLLGAAISAIAAALLLIGPRIVQTVAALALMRSTAQGGAQSQTRMAGAVRGSTGAMQGLIAPTEAVNRGLTAQQRLVLANAAAHTSNTTATKSSTVAQGQNASSTKLLKNLYGQFSGTIKKAAAATIAMTAAMVALTYWTAKAGDAAEQAQKDRAAAISKMKRDLFELVETEIAAGTQSGDAIRASAFEHVKATEAYAKLGRAADDLGIQMADLDAIIQNSGNAGENQGLLNDLIEKEAAGSQQAGKLLNVLKDLHEGYAGVAASTREAGEGTDDFTESQKEATKYTAEQVSALDAIAQAHIDMISAQFAQREAQLSLKDAEEDLAAARNKAGNIQDEIKNSELELRRARLSHEKALSDLRKAERDLARARQDGIDKLKDAEDSLKDARDSYLDNLDKVKDLEEELDALRSGPTVEQLTKATNDLRNAQLRLLDANRKVEDAEWQLQYLREQGASNRDLEDAEFALLEARQEVANQQQAVGESEKELSDLRDDASRQEEIIQLERELAAARRDTAAILRDIRNQEQEVFDLRQAVANDTFYKDAQAQLVEAQLRVRSALEDISEAELELQRIRSGGLQADAERAQLDYEQALYKVAQANVEVQRQQAAMNGEVWDAGDAARALATELGILASSTPNAEAAKRLRDFVGILSKAPDVPTASDTSGGGVETGEFPTAGLGVEELTFGDFLPEDFGKPSFWEGIAPLLLAGLAPALIQGIVAMAGSAAVVSFLTAALPFIIIGLLIAGIVAILVKDRNWAKVGGAILDGMKAAWGYLKDFGNWIWQNVLYPAISVLFPLFTQQGRDMIRGIWEGISGAAKTVLGAIGQKFYDWIIAPIKRMFGINSPSTVFSGLGGDIITGLWNGLVNTFNRLFGNIGQKLYDWIVVPLLGAGKWLVGTGSSILSGLWNGLVGWFNDNFYRLFTPFKWVTGLFDNAVEWLKNIGSNIITGLWNGIAEQWDKMTKWIGDAASHLPGFIKDPLGIKSPSKVFDMIGRYTMEGLDNGLRAGMDSVVGTVKQTADEMDLRKHLKSNNLEYLLSPEGFGSFDPATGSARVPDGRGGTTNNYGDVVTINAETNASPEEIVNEYVWNKRVRTRG